MSSSACRSAPEQLFTVQIDSRQRRCYLRVVLPGDICEGNTEALGNVYLILHVRHSGRAADLPWTEYSMPHSSTDGPTSATIEPCIPKGTEVQIHTGFQIVCMSNADVCAASQRRIAQSLALVLGRQ